MQNPNFATGGNPFDPNVVMHSGITLSKMERAKKTHSLIGHIEFIIVYNIYYSYNITSVIISSKLNETKKKKKIDNLFPETCSVRLTKFPTVILPSL